MPREKKPKPPTKSAIAAALAARIHAHLTRIENDPKLNQGKRYDRERKTWVPDKGGLRDFYVASARGERQFIHIVYITYQGSQRISIEEAERYVAWLDAGNVGYHYQVPGYKRA